MFASFNWSGVSAQAQTWAADLAPILLLLAGLGFALSLTGLALRLFGSRGSADSPPAGLSKR